MKSVLITGASSGIGKQLAVDYLADGWHVWACGRDKSRLSDFSSNVNAELLEFDVTNLQATNDALIELDPYPEVIILNAGNAEYIENGKIDSQLFKRLFDVNLFGVVNCIEALQSRFSKGTQLVIVSSSVSFVALPRAEAYGASKAAVSYLAKTLAMTLSEKKVKVSLVSPGFVKTPLTEKNDFPMPTAVSVAVASKIIRKGITKRKSEIHFPKKLTLSLKVVSLLPLSFQYFILKRFIKRKSPEISET